MAEEELVEISIDEFMKGTVGERAKGTLDTVEVRRALAGRILSTSGVEKVMRETLGKDKSWQLWWSVWKSLRNKWEEEGFIEESRLVPVHGKLKRFYKFANVVREPKKEKKKE